MTPVVASHIWVDEVGVARIDKTRFKVIQVASDYRAHGSSPEEMEHQYGGALSLAQIHAALAYYFDHQAELDAEIERQLTEDENLRAKYLDSPGRRRLRALGRIP